MAASSLTATLALLISLAAPALRSASATTTVVTLTSVATSFINAPIGIDYYEPTNEVVVSANYPYGSPNDFYAVDGAGNVSPLSTVNSIGDEVYMAAVRASACEAGFTPGDIYFGDGSQIAKLSPDGTLIDPWVTLSGETGTLNGGLFQDIYCTPGVNGALVVTTTASDVWTVTSAGAATEIASGFGGSFLEGPTTVPVDARYGPWSGTILASDETNGVIWSIDAATGTAISYDGGGTFGSAEGVHVVPPDENFFATDYQNGAVLAAPATQFAGVVGDVVLATEVPGKLLDITWDGASFQSYDLLSADAGQFEGTTFAPAGLPGIPSTLGDPTSLNVSSASGDHADSTSVSATLTDTTTSMPVKGEQVTLTLNGTEACTGTTNSGGVASCPITPGETPGGYTLGAAFGGDSNYQASTGSANFTVNLEETALSYTGVTSVVDGQPVALSGVLTTDDPPAGTALDGRTVSFTLGSGTTAQTCSGLTDATGKASCTVPSVSQTPGSVSVADSFAGDADYKASTSGTSMTVFAPTALGAFVIGNRSAGAPTNGKSVEFWGSQWSSVNSLSGGPAPSSMKGYANSPKVFGCGSTWTTATGSSSLPPATLPSVIYVVVSSRVTQSGSQLSGDIVHIVMVQVKPGYSNASGHTGTGTIIGTVC